MVLSDTAGELVRLPGYDLFIANLAMKQYVEGWFTAFPDLVGSVANIVANGDDVAAELTFKGTNTGSLQFNPNAPAMPPTGRVVNGRGTFFGRVQNGKFVELHTYPDVAGMMMQLGMMPQG